MSLRINPQRGLHRTVASAAVLLLASAVLAPGTEARAHEHAKFKVTVTGTDQATWNYQLPPCHGQAGVANGSQTVTYATAHSVTGFARSAGGEVPKLGPGPLDGLRFPVEAAITRQSSDSGCQGDDRTGPPDCGTKHFTVLANLRFLRRARLGFFSMAASLKTNVFHNCPNFGGYVGRDDMLGVGVRQAAPGRLSPKTLFHGRKRSFLVKGKGSERDSYKGGSVVLESSWTAHFHRLR
jgi:hypothetical protein